MATFRPSSTGHTLSAAEWIDTHFEACRDEYTAIVREVPFTRNGRIIDAGSGTGGFLPSLAEAAGQVIALDLAPEGLAVSSGRGFPCLQASIDSLPLADSSVDAVWCANVLQYLSDDDLDRQLREFRRVLRPGGILAVKDMDMTGWRVEPAPPFAAMRLAEACHDNDITGNSVGSLRGRGLKRFLDQAGFRDVSQSTHLIERWGPASGPSRELWSQWLSFLGRLAELQGLDGVEGDFWRSVTSPGAAEQFVARPDFYGCEMQVLAWGRAAS